MTWSIGNTDVVAVVILPVRASKSGCDPRNSLGIFTDRSKRGCIQGSPLTAEITLGEPLSWFNDLKSAYMRVNKLIRVRVKNIVTYTILETSKDGGCLKLRILETSTKKYKSEFSHEILTWEQLTRHHVGTIAFCQEVSSRWHPKWRYNHLSKMQALLAVLLSW